MLQTFRLALLFAGCSMCMQHCFTELKEWKILRNRQNGFGRKILHVKKLFINEFKCTFEYTIIDTFSMLLKSSKTLCWMLLHPFHFMNTFYNNNKLSTIFPSSLIFVMVISVQRIHMRFLFF